MTIDQEELIARAIAAQGHAYAPYSRFQVGAAIASGDRIFDGANVENASYGLAVCAERNAVLRAVLDGAHEIEAIAVVTESSPPPAARRPPPTRRTRTSTSAPRW